jgi:heat shock protein HtpX
MATEAAYQTSGKTVVIQKDLPDEAVAGLSELFERYYTSPNRRFIDQDSYRKTQSKGSVIFSWKLKLHPADQNAVLTSTLTISQTAVELNFPDLNKSDELQMNLCARTIDDVQNLVWSYLQHAKVSSLYFVIGANDEKQSEHPTNQGKTRRSILRRVFSGNTANTFLLFMLLSFVLLFLIGFYTVFVMIAFQAVYLFFSDRIVLSMGNVRPTSAQPLVTIVSVRSTPETLDFLRKHGKNILSDVRNEVSSTLVVPAGLADTSQIKSSVIAILARHGIKASMNDIEIKTKDVYRIVANVASKFNRPVPKIVIANTVVSNASATGISAKRSSIVITAGAFEDLNDEELESVIGHELGHVKGHDPVILFSVTSFEFIGRFYLWYPLLLYLGLFYFLLAFSAIFSIGKILETRADTESAVTLGNPMTMASALKKIGYRQFYREKYTPLAKFLDWFQFDPHPPIYFRVLRMSEFVVPKAKTHTFLISLRDCIVGVFSSLL